MRTSARRRRYSLLIGTPCFAGQVHARFAASLLKLQKEFIKRRWELSFMLDPGDALITRARQDIVCGFLHHRTATHLLFVDADIVFEPQQVLRLLKFGAEVTAAAYPVKRINWDVMVKAVRAKRKPLESATLTYVFDWPDKPVIRRGFMKTSFVGTGFLMVRRSALEAMVERYPELRYQHVHRRVDPHDSSPWRSALFNCMIDKDTGYYLSEDYSFCRRWTDMGGEIWVDRKSRLGHVGPIVYEGNLGREVTLPPL